MAERYYPFDAGAGASSTEDAWAKMHQQRTGRSGVVGTTRQDTDTSLRATLTSGLTFSLPIGEADIRGFHYENDSTLTRTGTANSNSNPRLDRLVLRLDRSANTIGALILQGTPAAAPSLPALTRTAAVWDIPLAYATCPGSGSAQTYTNLVRDRQFTGGAVIVGPTTPNEAFPGDLWDNGTELFRLTPGGVWVPATATGPLCILYASGDRAVGNQDFVQDAQWTVAKDSGSIWQPGIASSGGGFMRIPTTGRYEIDFHALFDGTGNHASAKITRNGYSAAEAIASDKSLIGVDTGAEPYPMHASHCGDVVLNAGDKIYFIVFSVNNSTVKASFFGRTYAALRWLSAA